MDIRVKKTKRAIQKAFVALLREKPIEKITVKEIAERAEINKTTFYSHYETLDALTAEMERQTVQLSATIWAAHSSCWIRRRLLCGRCLLISSRRPIISAWFLHQR